MNVLVTGGAGYIGSHTCVELIETGHTPIVIDNNGGVAGLTPPLLLTTCTIPAPRAWSASRRSPVWKLSSTRAMSGMRLC